MVRRVGVLVSFVVVGAVLGVLAVQNHASPGGPTPTPVPTVATGRICIAAVASLSSCDGVPAHPSVTPQTALAFFIESPIYEDLYVHVTVTRVAGNVAYLEVTRFDVQAIPNPYGVGNTLEPAQSFDPGRQSGEAVMYQLEASANGRRIAVTTFTVTP